VWCCRRRKNEGDARAAPDGQQPQIVVVVKQ